MTNNQAGKLLELAGLQWGDAMPFGKYKGLLVREVASFNPEYLAWAVNHLDRFELSAEARKLGQRELNKHCEQSAQRQNGWAWGFGREVRSAAKSWVERGIRLEMDARKAANLRAQERQS